MVKSGLISGELTTFDGGEYLGLFASSSLRTVVLASTAPISKYNSSMNLLFSPKGIDKGSITPDSNYSFPF